MGVRVYNSLSRSLEDFVPLEPGTVKLYACGPTVHDYAHIGNLRAFACVDLLHRYLEFRGFDVRFVMNVTDVDDKTIRRSREAGKSLAEYTQHFTNEFLADLTAIGVSAPDEMPLATKHIEEMIEVIQRLLDRGHAYTTDRGDVYFRIDSDPNYGKLARISTQELKTNAEGRLAHSDEYDKEHANDFALWKAYTEADGEVAWDAPFGRGRPGWHIECSAMSRKCLGQPIDIHWGGIDLLFPHHTNEIAQSECAYDSKFVSYWMHNEHLLVNGKKMSKSLGNFFTLRDLTSRGHDPLAIRFELLRAHYRTQFDFREEHFAENLQTLRRFADFKRQLGAEGKGGGDPAVEGLADSIREKFTDAMDDDLNIQLALAAIHEGIGTASKALGAMSEAQVRPLRKLFDELENCLGIFCWKEQVPELTAAQRALIDERNAARKAKDFKRADEIRKELLAQGIALEDKGGETRWSKA